jgi:hypothetical protein
MVENINPIANRSLTDTRFLSILPFLVILLGSLSLGVPNSEAVGKESQSESEDLSDSLGTGTESPSPDTESENFGTVDTASKESSNSETGGSIVTAYENMTNITASSKSNTSSPSDVLPNNQTSNLIEGSNATSPIREKLSEGIIPDYTITPLNTYKVTVVFDSHNST